MASEPQFDELLAVRLTLREDVRCALHESAGDAYYQIEDPLTGNIYRLGPREWQVARKLDGQRTLGEAAKQPSVFAGGEALTAVEAIALARWLVRTQLAKQDRFTHPLFAAAGPQANKLPAWVNPAFLRIPLGNPDPLLTRVTPWLRWTVSPLATAVWLVVTLAALYTIGINWSRFCQPMRTILAPDNWLYLLLVWTLLKALHELYHGIVCKKYGGRVPSFGVMLILFSPIAFVDVTSSWKFRSKWQRILTASAGMYIELFVASLTVLIWAQTDRPLLSQMCYNVIMIAGVSTLLFNGNFLMRFDGYYILTDLLGIQNLYSSGQTYVRYLGRRYLLGIRAAAIRHTPLSWFVKCYGLAAFLWRVLFYTGLSLTAATMFHGAGVVISVMILVAWLGIPAIRILKSLVAGPKRDRPSAIRCGAVFGGIGLAVSGVLALPWPGGVTANGVVEYEPLARIRTATNGFFRHWHVAPGAHVESGQRLATIENKQAEFQLLEVENKITQSEIEMLMLRDEKRYESIASKARDLQALKDRRERLWEQVESLSVKSPFDGRLIVRDPDSLVDQYVESGEVIFGVGREDSKAVIVMVAQKDADFFLRQLGTQPSVRVKGCIQPIRSATLVKIHPQATTSLQHGALAAPNGGPLAVVPRANQPSPAGSEPNDFDLVEPHFTATVRLPAAVSRRLRAGQIARVRIGAAGETIGQHLWAAADRWIRHRLSPPATGYR